MIDFTPAEVEPAVDTSPAVPLVPPVGVLVEPPVLTEEPPSSDEITTVVYDLRLRLTRSMRHPFPVQPVASRN